MGTQVKRPKPYPDIYLLGAERLGVKPANCIVFEDSPTGVAAGVAAGMRSGRSRDDPDDVRGDCLSRKELPGSGPGIMADGR